MKTLFNGSEKKMLYKLLLSSKEEVKEIILKNTNPRKYHIVDNQNYITIFPKSKRANFYPFLTCHVDTVFSKKPKIKEENEILKSLNDVGLGGDDRCGCFISLLFLKNDIDLFGYGIFDYEEMGCLGSIEMTKNENICKYIQENVSCIIGLDRRGHNQINVYTHTAEFIKILKNFIKKNKYLLKPKTMTDAEVLGDKLCICSANISVGYEREHTKKEIINLKSLSNNLLNIIKLPAEFWEKQFMIKKSQTYFFKKK